MARRRDRQSAQTSRSRRGGAGDAAPAGGHAGIGAPIRRRRRRLFLAAQLNAAAGRLRLAAGERLGFAEEALQIYGVRPELHPLSHYDPILARIERLVPGEGSLAARVEAFSDRFVIPETGSRR